MELAEEQFPIARILLSVAFGVAGLLEVGLLYLLLESRLPASIPPQIAAPGLNIPPGSTGGFVDIGLITLAVVAAVFVGLCALTWDTEPLELTLGRRTLRLDPVLGLEASLVVVGLPGTFDVILAGAAGVLPAGFPIGAAALTLGLGPLLITTLLVLLFRWFGESTDF